MKNIIIIAICLCAFRLYSQSLYTTAGAQCGAHGSGGCQHYQTPCPPGADAVINFMLRTDDQGQETSWQLSDITSGTVVQTGDNLSGNTTYDIRICAFNDHCYRLTLSDAGGNGLDPAKGGGYVLYFNGDKQSEGAIFTTTETVDLGGCCSLLEVTLEGGFACYDASIGLAVASVTGGVPPYTYTWSTGATYATTQPISPSDGLVSVAVTDAAGCVAADTLSVPAVGVFSLSTEATAPHVKGAADGKARAIPSGGIPPYQYTWSTGATTAIAENLAAGNYFVTVHDAGGCSASGVVGVPEGPSGVTDKIYPLEGLNLFPNPTTGQATVVFRVREAGNGWVQVFNAAGRLQQSRTIRAFVGENQFVLDLTHLPNGAYIVYLRIGQAAGSRWLTVME